MVRVVIDTNVFVSGTIKSKGNEAAVLDLIAQHTLRLCITEAITKEYAEVLGRPEPDNRFLECAQASRADYLITGNKKHFPSQWQFTRIVNAGNYSAFRDKTARFQTS